MSTEGPVVRLAHFSDIHLNGPYQPWTWRDQMSKRLIGLVNARWGRGRLFIQAARVLQALRWDIEQRQPDHLVFSGDATTLGFPAEMEQAATQLQPSQGPPGLAVPGNHDLYTRQAVESGAFEKWFGPWQVGERIDRAIYPFAQRVGPLWLIAVNSSTANRWPSDSSGEVGPAQRERLRHLLDTLSEGPRVLVTHYPVARADGTPEPPHRCLRDLAEVMELAISGKVALWLHGHRHDAYVLTATAPFPVICAGSATQDGHWSYHEYAIDGRALRGERRSYRPETGKFVMAGRFAAALRHG